MAAVATLMLSAGCQQQTALPTSLRTALDTTVIDQSRICEVSDWRGDVVATACKPGQKVFFQPQTFGNEQLPVIFAAVNCDLRYQVALTVGAVTCIYLPLQQATPEAAPKAIPSQPE